MEDPRLLGELDESAFNLLIDAMRGELPLLVTPASREPSQNFDSLIDRLDSINVKFLGRCRIDNFLAQHEVLEIRCRNQHAVLASQSLRLANIEEALDFLIHAADSLNLSVLIH